MFEFIHESFSEFQKFIEMFWWSFIKAPAAIMAAWGFFSLIADPANVAAQSMLMLGPQGIDPALLARIVSTWFLSGCAALGFSILNRISSKMRIFHLSGNSEEHKLVS